MRRSPPIQLIVRVPTTEKEKRALACRASVVQAEVVGEALCRLNCPVAQKLTLLDAIIDAAKKDS